MSAEASLKNQAKIMQNTQKNAQIADHEKWKSQAKNIIK